MTTTPADQYANEYLVEDLRVLEVHASNASSEPDDHFNWYVGVAPELESDEEDAGLRVVIGTLHAYFNEGRADVTVGAMIRSLVGDEDLDEVTLLARVGESTAIETLYDFGRTSLRTIFGMLDVDETVPRSSPPPEMHVLERGNGGDDDDSPEQESHAHAV